MESIPVDGQTKGLNAVVPDSQVKSLASSIFKNLCKEGYQPKDIIGVSSQLLSLVTLELQKDTPAH